MIRRIKGALEWRLRAVTSRLDELNARAARLQTHLDHVDARLERASAAIEELARGSARVEEAVATTHGVLKQRVTPALRAIVDEESENRRRLYALRAGSDYHLPYTEPNPLVSVAIATTGRAELLSRSLPSLLEQTHANLEIVVVGDATGPALADAIASLGDARVSYAALSQRITAHEDPRRHWLVGSTMARNEAARRANGRWLVHFDDDDSLRPVAIASLVEAAREQRCEVVYGGYEEHHPDGTRSTSIGFPPRLGCFSWGGALVHRGLRFFERELVAASLELPGDVYMLERMLRVGVRFGLLETVVLDYFPSTLWQVETGAAAPSPAHRGQDRRGVASRSD